MLEINESQKEERNKYPELKAMVEEYIATDGKAVDGEDGEKQLPKLIVWMRTHLENDIGWDRMCEFLEWDEDGEQWKDFTSWGHNSRWSRVFWPWVDGDFEYAVSVAIALQHVIDGEELP